MSLSVTREQLEDIATEMQGYNEPAPLIPTGHFFGDGIYQRTTFVPKGAIVVGKIHAHSTVNTVVGKCLAANPEQPEKNSWLIGLQVFESPAMSRRFVMALEDTFWITVHASDSKDLKTLEEEFTVKDYDQLTLEEKACLGAL